MIVFEINVVSVQVLKYIIYLSDNTDNTRFIEKTSLLYFRLLSLITFGVCGIFIPNDFSEQYMTILSYLLITIIMCLYLFLYFMETTQKMIPESSTHNLF
jgi:uncharacterized membrane protein YjjP (DUF1212 family)